MATKLQLSDYFRAEAPNIAPDTSGNLQPEDWAVVLMGLLGNTVNRYATIYLGDHTVRLSWAGRPSATNPALQLHTYPGRWEHPPVGQVPTAHEVFGSSLGPDELRGHLARVIRTILN